MPIIVPIEDNKVGLATATDAKFRAPDYSGSGLDALGAGLAQLGGGGQQLASGLEERRRRAAEAIVAAMLDDRHQSNIDDAAVKQAYVDYSHPTHEALHGEDGLFNRQGADAHAAFPGVVEKLVDNHDKSLSKLDDVQRAAVAPAMNERLRSDVERAAEHVRQQGAAEQKWQSEQLQKAAARDAVNHADDPDLFDHHLMTGEKTIRQQAKIDNVGDKLLDKQLADYRSGVHADTIEALAQRDPAQAADWYARHGDNLNRRDKLRVDATLGPAPADAQTAPGADLASPYEPAAVAADIAINSDDGDRDHRDNVPEEPGPGEGQPGIIRAASDDIDASGVDGLAGMFGASSAASAAPRGKAAKAAKAGQRPQLPPRGIAVPAGKFARGWPLGFDGEVPIAHRGDPSFNKKSYANGGYDPEHHDTTRFNAHFGVDIKGAEGDNVYAAAAGKLWHAGWIAGYGYSVGVATPDGYVQLYGHLTKSDFAELKRHPDIAQGQIIGTIGNTGNASDRGDHLHFEVRRSNGSATFGKDKLYKGATVDPLAWLAGRLEDTRLVPPGEAPYLPRNAQPAQKAAASAHAKMGRPRRRRAI